MGAKVFVLIIIQLCRTVAQLNTTQADTTAHNASIKDFQQCQLNRIELHWRFEVSGQLSGSSSLSIEKLTDLWTSQCEVIDGNIISENGNPLEVIRSNISSVIIMDTNITGFKSDYFCHFNNLEILIMENNRLNDATKIGFNVNSECSRSNCYHRLYHLTLSRNPLRVIKNNSFCGLFELNYLDLDNCELYSIESGAFIHSTQLSRLDLSNNHLKRLPSQLFRSTPYLHDLFVAFNNLSAIPDIQDLVELMYIELNNNAIQSVRKFDFFNCTQLFSINVSHNVISSIEDGAFDGGYELNVLDLSNNRLQTLNEKIFRLNIKEIFLNNNQLTSVMLDELGNHIRALYLKGNRISQLNSEDVLKNRYEDEGKALNLIDLSNNKLKMVKHLYFPNSVRTIILDNNNMTHLSFESLLEKRVIGGHTSLQEVSLQNNSFDYVPMLPYHCKERRNADPFYNFNENPLKCSCESVWFLQTSITNEVSTGLSCQPSTAITAKHLFPKANVLSTNQLCESSYNNSNRCLLFKDLDLYVPTEKELMYGCDIIPFECHFECPRFCHCYTTFTFSAVHLYCSQTKMKTIPQTFDIDKLGSESEVILWLDGNDFGTINSTDFDIFIDVVRLYLNRSCIDTIDELAFRDLTALRVLNLNDNNLQTLPLGLFDHMTKLEALHLANNKLSHFHDDIFRHLELLQTLHLEKNLLSKFAVWNLKNQLSLKELTLHDNSWSCDCGFVVDFQRYLKLFDKIVNDSSRITCTSEDKHLPQLSIINFDESVCADNNLIMWASLGSAFVLVMLSLLLSYFYRRELQLLVYSRVRRRVLDSTDSSDGKLFDVFVAYSNDDFDFVYNNILPGLEGITNPYRVCVHERDFLAGCVIADNILEAVRISSRTIILLTDNFVRSGWCRFEFKAAHLQMLEDRCPRVLVIVVGHIPANLEPEMLLYLKTNTYLTWGEPLFWQKLHNAMPKERATGVGVERSPNLMPPDIEIESSV